MFDDWKQIECPREFSPEFYENHEEHVNNSRTLRDVQILSLPDMFLRWDRGGPRPWPEDCCRIGLSRIEDSDSIIPCVFIGIMWRSLETDENFRKSHLHSMMFLFFYYYFSRVAEVMAGVRLDGCCMIASFEVFLEFWRYREIARI